MYNKTILTLFVSITFLSCNIDKKYKSGFTAKQKTITEVEIDTNGVAENYVKKKDLFGKVKTIKTVTYNKVSNKFGKIILGNPNITFNIYNTKGEIVYGKSLKNNSKFYMESYVLYNDNGNIVEKSTFKSDGSLHKKVTYTYNANGKKTARNEYNYENKLINRITYKYNEWGKKVEVNFYKEDSCIVEKELYKYNNKGIRTSYYIFYYKKDGLLYEKSIYEYNNKGKLIKSDIYNLLGRIKSIYSYDNKGLKTEKYIKYYNNTLKQKGKRKYDEQDNIIISYSYLAGELFSKEMYNYNKKGKLLERKSYLYCCGKRKKNSNSTYKYDDYNNLIEICYTNGIGQGINEWTEIYENKYKYDSKHNWIELKHFSNKILDKLVKREIEYYK